MQYRRVLTASLALVMSCTVAAGKDKKKILLPADVLQARTVLVIIDPDTGISPDAPLANRTAQEDVEKALMKWGRFELVINVATADLVITVRKGNGKTAQPTIGGLPTNNRPVILEPTDSGGRVGGGNMPPISSGSQRPEATPQVEIGAAEDMFVVYRGGRDDALDAPPVWRYSTKNALSSPAVPAVEAFRKLILEAEKQQSSHP